MTYEIKKHTNSPPNDSDDNQTSGLESRKCAIDILDKILIKRLDLDRALNDNDTLPTLSVRDRGFVRHLVASTLRHLGQIDDLIMANLDDPKRISQPRFFHLLRIAITQLLILKTPPHAAVNGSVTLADGNPSLRKYKGVINGVLRHIAREFETLSPHTIDLNTPEYLRRAWLNDYGQDVALKIAKAHLSEASLDISFKNDAARTEFIEALDPELYYAEMPNGQIRLMDAGNVTHLPFFDAGTWWVQDFAANLPVHFLGDIEEKRVLDLCAAPGGKTAQIASKNAGGTVTALDRSPARFKRFDDNMERLGFNDHVEKVIADATQWHSEGNPKQEYDAILLDAPCSATGTIRRHPDLPYLKSEKDIDNLSNLQKRILSAASKMLAIDGMMIYCTCSLQKNEGEDQIVWFLNEYKNFERVPLTADDVFGFEELINDQGDMRALPFHLKDYNGLDGFFAARLKRLS